jgi:hypothetical protein
MPERIAFTPPPPPFSREEKAGLTLLVVCGILGLFFGFRYLGKHLQAGYTISYAGERYASFDEAKDEERLRQRSRDTDGDGLSDYDELYILETSPYLSDSDSDGRDDQTELSEGGDPLCPQGKECGEAVATETDAARAGDSILNGLVPPEFDVEGAEDLLKGAGASPLEQEADIEALRAGLRSLPMDDLRVLLLESGLAPAVLEGLSDEDLQALYLEVLSQVEVAP